MAGRTLAALPASGCSSLLLSRAAEAIRQVLTTTSMMTGLVPLLITERPS